MSVRRERAAPRLPAGRGDTDGRAERDGWMTRDRVLALFLLILTGVVLYLCYRLMLPFVPALTWAVALAVIAYPLHEWLRRRLHNRSIVAGATVLIVTIIVVVPAGWVARQIVHEAVQSVEQIQSDIASERWLNALKRNPRFAPAMDWLKREINVREQLESVGDDVMKSARGLVSGSIYAVTGLLITLFLLFYFFRDRERILEGLHEFVPLSRGETDQLMRRVRETIHASIYGTLTVALLQGTLGGLMFWFLGLPAPLLWGAVMAVLAILPILGTTIVWLPAAVFLALEGDYQKALILAAWGALAIGLIDNLVYPLLVKDKLRLHAVPVFISVLGGLIVFGVAGVILGPVVLAVAVALLDIWRRRMAHGHAADTGIGKQE